MFFFVRNKVVLIGTVLSGSIAKLALKVLDTPADLAMSSRYSDIFVYMSAPDEINARTRSTLLDNEKIAVSYVKVDDSPQVFTKD